MAQKDAKTAVHIRCPLGKKKLFRMEIFQAHTGEEHKLMYLNQQIFGEAKVGKIIRIYGMEEMILHNSAVFGKRARAYFSARFLPSVGS